MTGTQVLRKVRPSGTDDAVARRAHPGGPGELIPISGIPKTANPRDLVQKAPAALARALVVQAVVDLDAARQFGSGVRLVAIEGQTLRTKLASPAPSPSRSVQVSHSSPTPSEG